MKILSTLFIVISYYSFAQITHEKTYFYSDYVSGGNFEIIDLEGEGKKYVLSRDTGRTYEIYNLEHSLYKTFVAPVMPSEGAARYISNKLFDIDADLEYVIQHTQPSEKMVIYNEDGTVLFEKDSVLLNTIFNTSTGTKMILYNYSKAYVTNYEEYLEVYSLPGKYNAIKKIEEKLFGSKIFPNPSNGKITVDFKEPFDGIVYVFNIQGKIVHQQQIQNQKGKIELNILNQAAGTYIIKAVSDQGMLEDKIIISK